MPGGNESDFTLSLKALDRLLTLLETQNLPLRIAIFIGDVMGKGLPAALLTSAASMSLTTALRLVPSRRASASSRLTRSAGR